MRKKVIAIYVLFIMGFQMGYAQNAPVVTIGNAFTNGSVASVTISVENFVNIKALDLKMEFDETIIEYSEITFGPGVSFESYSVNPVEVGNGIIIFGGFLSSGLDLSDGAVLMYIHFNKVFNGTSLVSFVDDDDSFSCLWTNGAGVELNDTPSSDYYHNGTVSFSQGLTAPVTTIPDQLAVAGQTVLLPVRVNGFYDVGAASLTIKYLPEVLSDPVFENSSGVLPLTMNVPESGTLRISGFSSVEGGHDLSDGSVFFTLAFKYLGGTTGVWFSHDFATTCQYGGPPPMYSGMQDNPKELYFIDGSVGQGTPLSCSMMVLGAESYPGAKDGEASVLAVGGWGDYHYMWSNGETASSTTQLSAGTYSVTVTDGTGNSTVCEAEIGYLPDITPSLTVTPNIFNGTTSFVIILKITEINGTSSSGLIRVMIPLDIRWEMDGGSDPLSVYLGSEKLNNDDWVYEGSDEGYHVFSSHSVIPGNSFSSFSFRANFYPGNTQGIYTITSQLETGSGGDGHGSNNSDSEKLDYFTK